MAAPAGGSVRDTPKLECELRGKIKVFNTSNFNQLEQDKYNLVASSPQHGLVFVASTDGLLAVYQMNELLYGKVKPSRVTVKLPEEPTHIAVNRVGELLAVVGHETLIYIYNVKDIQNQDASPMVSGPRGSSYFACDMQWSPSMNGTLAIAFHDKITIIHVDAERSYDNTNNSGIRCLSWDPNGCSLVVGYADGTLRVYSLDLSLEESIPAPAPRLFGGASLVVRAVHWMSTKQFAVVYNHRDTTQANQSAFTLITSQGEFPPRVEYVRRLESDLEYPRYSLLQIKPWNVMLCWPTRKTVIKLLPPDSDGGDSQAPVQLLSKLLREDDLYPVGVAFGRDPVIRLSSQPHLHQPTHQAMLHVLTQTGDLATYFITLLQSNQLCSASQNSSNEQLQIPTERDRDEPSTSGAHPHQPVCAVIGEGQPPDPNCIICCKYPKDSVLYMCGHTCMCYDCAVDQWQGQGDGQCPLCRTEILDVFIMRTYNS